MALVAILIGNDDFLFLLPWMATRAIPTFTAIQGRATIRVAPTMILTVRKPITKSVIIIFNIFQNVLRV